MAENSEWEEVTKAKTHAETDKKCPQCSGVMDYSPATGKLKCPFCEYEMAFKNEAEKSVPFVAEELDFDTAEEHATTDWGIDIKTVNCKSCGAETVYDANQMANECPYCGSNQVMEKADDSVMAPSGVVVFTIEAKEAGELFVKWIKDSWFCVSSAKEKARPDSFRGVYLPYWTFDAKTLSNYNGEYGIDRTVTDSDGKERTETDWYRTSGTFSRIFDDWLVCASKKQNTNMLKSIEPYKTKDVKEYRPEYMAGFVAERYSLPLKDAWVLAEEGMDKCLGSEISSEIKKENYADHVRSLNVYTTYSDKTYKYLLLPVWMSSFRHNGKIYNFMVNGQTGKVHGEFPISWIKVALVTIVVIAIIGLLIYMEL